MFTLIKKILAILFICFGIGFFMYQYFNNNVIRPNYSSSILPKAYMNDDIMKVLGEYREKEKRLKTAGKDFMKTVGISEPIYYQGRKILSPDKEKKTHCSGITFEIFMKACERAGGKNFVLNSLSSSNFGDFRKEWYGTDGNQRTLVDALTNRSLGKEIHDPGEARPGDFIQFWRMGGTGHSVIFLGWKFDEDGKINGIKYWSSQFNYVGEEETMIGPKGFEINPEKIYIVRAYKP